MSRVSPISGLSPAVTAVLAIGLLSERPALVRIAGIVVATAAVSLLGAAERGDVSGERGWLPLAVASLLLQGFGAFVAKVVVTPSGPSALLVVSAAVQAVVGAVVLRRTRTTLPRLDDRIHQANAVILLLAALATVGYLFALARGPASVVVPLVATSPALGGLLGALVLEEGMPPVRVLGITLGLVGGVLLSVPV